MTRTSLRWLRVVAGFFAAAIPVSSLALATQVFPAAGPNAAAIQSTVDAFRASLGALNPNTAGSAGSGRREINWDGVPDALAAPNNLPANFFNSNSPRGAVFSTPGSGFQVSANNGVAPVRFANVNATYATTFQTFSAQRLFAALGSNVLDVSFFIPGSGTPAQVAGFGAIFTDVGSANTSSIEYFDAYGNSLGLYFIPSSPVAGLSFLGVTMSPGNIARVRITSGTVALGPTDALPANDAVALDDFIYGEPVPTSPLVPAAGLWWNPNESGSGYALDAKHGVLVLTVYSYKANGDSEWYIATGPLTNNGRNFSGVLDKIRNGQCISCPYNGLPVYGGSDGTVTIEFSSPTAAVMHLPGGRVINIIPQAF